MSDIVAALRRRTLPLRAAGDARTLALLLTWRRLAPGPPRALALRGVGTFRMRPGRDRLDMLSDAVVWRFHLPPPEVVDAACVWDLGATLGYTAADLARRFPRAQLTAVEADPSTCAVARENLAPLAPRVAVVCGAVWTARGEVRLRVDSADSQAAAVASGDGVAVPAVDPAGLPVGPDGRVDYVKMDIEGAEAAVLGAASAGEWLARVRVIKVEVHAPYTTAECERDLRAHGMTTRRDDRHWATVIGVSPR